MGGNAPAGADYEFGCPWNDSEKICEECGNTFFSDDDDVEYCYDCGRYFEDEDRFIYADKGYD